MKALIVLLFVIGSAVPGKQKRLIGNAPDPPALLKVQTFCVEADRFGPLNPDALKKFIAEQSRPGKLLTRLPWKLTVDCSGSDAVAALSLEEKPDQTPHSRGGTGVDFGYPSLGEKQVKYVATMTVSERSSKRVLYQVHSEKATSQGGAFSNSFTKLEKDLKTVAETGVK